MKSAVTICLVPTARGGPFVFHNGLADGCAQAAHFGFDAVEIFPPSAAAIDRGELRQLLATHRLSVAAFGTGAGWLLHRLTLTSPSADIRTEARRFVASIIEAAACFGAPAIIGSMQGRLESDQDRSQALAWLSEALVELAQLAESHHVPLLIEPLNRYETSLLNRLGQSTDFLRTLATTNIQLLADLFHMNIEEADIPAALREAGPVIGHVHFADSNRQAIGFGHTEFGPVISALREIGYTKYLSAEVFPLPTPAAAAEQTIAAIRRFSP